MKTVKCVLIEENDLTGGNGDVLSRLKPREAQVVTENAVVLYRDCVVKNRHGQISECVATPNDPKLSDSGPGARV